MGCYSETRPIISDLSERPWYLEEPLSEYSSYFDEAKAPSAGISKYSNPKNKPPLTPLALKGGLVM